MPATNGTRTVYDTELLIVKRIERALALLPVSSQDRVVRMIVSRLAERRSADGQPEPGASE